MNLNELLIPNIDKFKQFYRKMITENNMNILVYGPRESCKTTIIEFIIKEFIERYEHKFKEAQLVFRLNAFDEINLQSQNNEMSIFCQNNTNTNKIVYIDKFEFFSDSNQQLLKIYIDKYNGFKKYNKVFFIIETIQIEKVRDIIKSRLNIFKTDALTNIQYERILMKLLKNEKISIDQATLNYITNIPNLYISTLKNIVNKCKLLNYQKITSKELPSLCNFIDFALFDEFFEEIHTNIKCSSDILIRLYEDGYDISDIYFYLYEYIKTQKRSDLYCLVELICFYINEIYNGNYNKIMLVILTYEIRQKLAIENKVSI
uniref:AAA domain-containing protein n=1 Tax=viral metagenome TaxID=1070528 RepID=A0A6C0KX30_9ZZZZ|tara:strand:+ start:5809 stop:6762 length:954 start_codon:yes stop_codon:yes gene_type:complete